MSADGEQAGLTAVLLIAHGSRHQPANDDLIALARRMESLAEFAIVEASFLELADPDIAQGGARCALRGAARVLMVPYFLAAGVHLIRDLTAARDALIACHPEVQFRLGPPLGPHPLLDELVAQRARELEQAANAPDYAPAAIMAERYPSRDHS